MEKDRTHEFEMLVEKYSRFIESQILQFNPQKNGIDPDDIVQEVKIKLWNVLIDEKKIYSISSYIKKIVNSCVIDQIRKSKREEGVISKEKRKKISDRRSYYKKHNFSERELKNMVGEAVESLMESRRRVVRLFLLNMTLQEIAIVLNWSEAKTRNLLYRGLDDLKRMLREKGIEYEDQP
jgi:RNA polymerase sigma-70 factor (ECF subfamily)